MTTMVGLWLHIHTHTGNRDSQLPGIIVFNPMIATQEFF